MTPPPDTDPRLRAILDALKAQDLSLAELTNLTEKQADAIGGLVLVLRALMDTLLNEEQRMMLESHLQMTTAGDRRRAKRSMVDALRERPEIGKPLRRELEGYWSARVGRYRVIYRRSRGLLAVVLVGPRATLYEDASRLRRRDRCS